MCIGSYNVLYIALFHDVILCSIIGVDVGGRWKELFETIRPHIDDHVLNFNDNHILLACLGANEKQVVNQMMDSIKDWLQ